MRALEAGPDSRAGGRPFRRSPRARLRADGTFPDGRPPCTPENGIAFLILIEVVLVADGLGRHIAKGCACFATAFSLGVELLNVRVRRVAEPVRLRLASVAEAAGPPPAE